MWFAGPGKERFSMHVKKLVKISKREAKGLSTGESKKALGPA